MAGEKKKQVDNKPTKKDTVKSVEPKVEKQQSEPKSAPERKKVAQKPVVEDKPKEKQQDKPKSEDKPKEKKQAKPKQVEVQEEEVVPEKKVSRKKVDPVPKPVEVKDVDSKKRKNEAPSSQPAKKEKSESTSQRTTKNTILVGNLPKHMTEGILKHYLAEIGNIVFVDLDLQEHCAIVQFDKDLSDEVLEYNGANIEGSRVKVSFLGKQSATVRIVPLHKEVTESILKEYISEIGPIESIKIQGGGAKDENYPNIGFVTFKDVSSVKKAREYNGAEIRGRVVTIRQEK